MNIYYNIDCKAKSTVLPPCLLSELIPLTLSTLLLLKPGCTRRITFDLVPRFIRALLRHYVFLSVRCLWFAMSLTLSI